MMLFFSTATVAVSKNPDLHHVGAARLLVSTVVSTNAVAIDSIFYVSRQVVVILYLMLLYLYLQDFVYVFPVSVLIIRDEICQQVDSSTYIACRPSFPLTHNCAQSHSHISFDEQMMFSIRTRCSVHILYAA